MGIVQFANEVFMMVPLKTSNNWEKLAFNLTQTYIHGGVRNASLIGQTNTEKALRHMRQQLQMERDKT